MCVLSFVPVLTVVYMGKWSELSVCAVCHVVRW